ncbi:MAG: beta galactosidase jelly roll domain-containing protein [Treponema sp.]|nr:beta galactosidase jelly roll domain-containing protein [Treponema sp.]
MKCYKAGYPRPQFVRNDQSWENLNGLWDFAFDDKNEGIEKKWYNSFPQCTKIMVPFAYECPASGIGDITRHNYIWYKRVININSKQKSDSRIMLHFEGSDYNTRLWINGKFAGMHNGGYARFSFDITKLAKSGKNTIIVRVEDSFDISQPRGKQRWMEDNFGCWYIQTTGIWKTVWIEYVNDIHINRVKMTPVLSTGKLEIEAEISSDSEEDLELEVLIFLKNMPVNIISAPVKENHCEITADIFQASAIDSETQLWSPEHPNLYDISLYFKKKE